MDFIVIIPARYNSTRLPAKLLQDIHGKSVIQRTYDNAIKSNASKVIIATDDVRIANICQDFGANVCLTSKNHNSGSKRVAEVIVKEAIDAKTIIVNLQGDEPMLPAKLINQVAANIIKYKSSVATLCEVITSKEQYYDANCVKVVRDKNNNALYFSRAGIPYFREGNIDLSLCYRHIGIYAYSADFLQKHIKNTTSVYENAELLEQLSILYNSHNIHTDIAIASAGLGIDTQEDLDNVRDKLK